MFVKLTWAGSDDGRMVWTRADSIINIMPNWCGHGRTHVITTAGEFDVVETPEQICNLIQHAEMGY